MRLEWSCARAASSVKWYARHRQALGSDQSDTYATEDAPRTLLSCHHIERVILSTITFFHGSSSLITPSPITNIRCCHPIMSASSPLPSFSSPASSRLPTVRRASFSGQLAFLVHSQETVANHMPPDVDNKALARQKRRRTRYALIPSKFCLSISTVSTHVQRVGSCATYHRELLRPTPRARLSITPSALTTTSCSKEDEDVLKSEYLKNPKPDKAARLEIVRKVALGEKEVQVSANFSTSRVCAPC